MTDLTKLMGVGPAMALKLDEMGVSTLEDMARADAAKIAELPRVTTARAQDWIDSASRLTAPAPDADVPAAVASDVPRTAAGAMSFHVRFSGWSTFPQPV